ncbi:hypothetical protein HDU76_002970 [Blyttiomyces sp. JEL0837]|nr:hypothetical protein HDU76_002970 [Blyttiomyces sp. JEL0837]
MIPTRKTSLYERIEPDDLPRSLTLPRSATNTTKPSTETTTTIMDDNYPTSPTITTQVTLPRGLTMPRSQIKPSDNTDMSNVACETTPTLRKSSTVVIPPRQASQGLLGADGIKTPVSIASGKMLQRRPSKLAMAFAVAATSNKPVISNSTATATSPIVNVDEKVSENGTAGKDTVESVVPAVTSPTSPTSANPTKWEDAAKSFISAQTSTLKRVPTGKSKASPATIHLARVIDDALQTLAIDNKVRVMKVTRGPVAVVNVPVEDIVDGGVGVGGSVPMKKVVVDESEGKANGGQVAQGQRVFAPRDGSLAMLVLQQKQKEQQQREWEERERQRLVVEEKNEGIEKKEGIVTGGAEQVEIVATEKVGQGGDASQSAPEPSSESVPVVVVDEATAVVTPVAEAELIAVAADAVATEDSNVVIEAGDHLENDEGWVDEDEIVRPPAIVQQFEIVYETDEVEAGPSSEVTNENNSSEGVAVEGGELSLLIPTEGSFAGPTSPSSSLYVPAQQHILRERAGSMSSVTVIVVSDDVMESDAEALPATSAGSSFRSRMFGNRGNVGANGAMGYGSIASFVPKLVKPKWSRGLLKKKDGLVKDLLMSKMKGMRGGFGQGVGDGGGAGQNMEQQEVVDNGYQQQQLQYMQYQQYEQGAGVEMVSVGTPTSPNGSSVMVPSRGQSLVSPIYTSTGLPLPALVPVPGSVPAGVSANNAPMLSADAPAMLITARAALKSNGESDSDNDPLLTSTSTSSAVADIVSHPPTQAPAPTSKNSSGSEIEPDSPSTHISSASADGGDTEVENGKVIRRKTSTIHLIRPEMTLQEISKMNDSEVPLLKSKKSKGLFRGKLGNGDGEDDEDRLQRPKTPTTPTPRGGPTPPPTTNDSARAISPLPPPIPTFFNQNSQVQSQQMASTPPPQQNAPQNLQTPPQSSPPPPVVPLTSDQRPMSPPLPPTPLMSPSMPPTPVAITSPVLVKSPQLPRPGMSSMIVIPGRSSSKEIETNVTPMSPTLLSPLSKSMTSLPPTPTSPGLQNVGAPAHGSTTVPPAQSLDSAPGRDRDDSISSSVIAAAIAKIPKPDEIDGDFEGPGSVLFNAPTTSTTEVNVTEQDRPRQDSITSSVIAATLSRIPKPDEVGGDFDGVSEVPSVTSVTSSMIAAAIAKIPKPDEIPDDFQGHGQTLGISETDATARPFSFAPSLTPSVLEAISKIPKPDEIDEPFEAPIALVPPTRSSSFRTSTYVIPPRGQSTNAVSETTPNVPLPPMPGNVDHSRPTSNLKQVASVPVLPSARASSLMISGLPNVGVIPAANHDVPPVPAMPTNVPGESVNVEGQRKESITETLGRNLMRIPRPDEIDGDFDVENNAVPMPVLLPGLVPVPVENQPEAVAGQAKTGFLGRFTGFMRGTK